MKRITIKEIAQKANLSIATVSRALNPETKHLVKKDTLDRILQITEQEHYTPSLLARELVTGKSYSIVLFIKPDFKSVFFNDYYSKIITGAMNGVEDAPYQLLVSLIRDEVGGFNVENAIKRMNVAGAILCNFIGVFNVSAKNIYNMEIPVVVINQYRTEDNPSCFTIDHFSAAYEATTYLIARGHTRIGFIRGKQTIKDSEDRYFGFKKALDENGIPHEQTMCFQGDLEESSGKDAARYFLKELTGERPTAVFSANDQMAMGFLSELPALGVTCPKDISVIGFDGVDAGRYTMPPLTSVRQPGYDMAKAAVAELIDLIDHHKSFIGTRYFKAKIIERGSVADIRG